MTNPVYTRVPLGIFCVHTTSLAAIDLPRDEHDTHLLICFILFSHQNINSVVTLELLLTSITAKPPSLMP